MSPNFIINTEAYAKMLGYLDNLSTTDKPGLGKDSFFIAQNYWLQDTAVVENIEYRNGQWEIALVFAHTSFPLKLLKRKITSFGCPKKLF